MADTDGSTVPPAPPPAEWPATIGRYVILGRLGAGGMGVVYSAFDPVLDRKVAIKLVHPAAKDGGSAEKRRARLVREAQAMAQVVHPNVVAVHDAGTHGEDVFITMDFVEGRTLRAWLADEPRRWRDVLAVFVDAGRGLEAAHRAGIVHRDFKPENVLLRADGRALVGDFGVARALGGVDDDGAAAASGSGLLMPLTVTGASVGTPAYMSPEQHEGAAVDERTDQFSFCVALYEALYAQRPLAGEVLARRVMPPPRKTRVPAWLGRVVMRGLSPERGERYPSMTVLLSELQRDRARRWRRAAMGAAIVAAAGVAVAGARRGDPCAGAGERLSGVWDDGARAAVRAAFLATGRAYAADTSARVQAILDGYGTAWAAMRVDACRATAVRHEQSPGLMDLRMSCLERRLGAVRALVGVYSAKAGGDVLDHAVDAALGLEPLDGCADAAALRAQFPPPPAAMRDAVQAAAARLDEGDALLGAGVVERAGSIAEAAVAEVQATAYPPLVSRALELVARARFERRRDPAGIETALREALRAATEARADDAAVRVLTHLVVFVGANQARVAEGLTFVVAGDALLRRSGDDPKLRAQLVGAAGRVLARAGRLVEAQAFLEIALGMAERAGMIAADRLAMLQQLAEVLTREEKYERAVATAERALALARQTIGPEHPRVAAMLNTLGSIDTHRGDRAAALARYREAEALLERSLPGSASLGTVRANVGMTLNGLGRRDEARVVLERSLAEREAMLGPDHIDLKENLSNLGTLYQETGELDKARRAFERAIAIVEKTTGPEDPSLAPTLYNLASLLLQEGRPAEARPHLERALRLSRLAHTGPSVISETIAVSLAESLVAMSRPAEAVPLLEAALPVLDAGARGKGATADARLLLGRALWDLGRERPRARALVREAQPLYVARGDAKHAAEAETWLSRH